MNMKWIFYVNFFNFSESRIYKGEQKEKFCVCALCMQVYDEEAKP